MGKREGGKSKGGGQRDSRTKVKSSRRDFPREKSRPPKRR